MEIIPSDGISKIYIGTLLYICILMKPSPGMVSTNGFYRLEIVPGDGFTSIYTGTFIKHVPLYGRCATETPHLCMEQQYFCHRSVGGVCRINYWCSYRNEPFPLSTAHTKECPYTPRHLCIACRLFIEFYKSSPIFRKGLTGLVSVSLNGIPLQFSGESIGGNRPGAMVS